ncbi:hypothetical protein LZ554_002657 [Drepanopeziza brunnea f. sp. 'monogermtubi']|nr:hypothetical protein LZ554_002657 [Drepanopeziza brunnea f. sp. 'monogermtubi']
MAAQPRNIGFIGLGIMGLPMAINLAKKLPAKSRLYAYDISADALAKLLETESDTDVQICKSSREVASKSDVIFTMVPEGAHVRAVYLSPDDGILASSNLSSKILIDCSTIDTATSSLVRSSLATQHPTARFYDAPVSGGSLGAADGSLTLMLGAADDDPNGPLLHELLGLLGRSVFACGGPSMGLTAKLCNNYCSGLIAIATAEAFNIGIRSGMDPRVLAQIFATSTAQSTICDKWNPVPGVCPAAPASKDYAGGFKVQLMKKDFGLAVAAAEHVGARLQLGEAGLQTYAAASEDPNCRDRDSRVVFRYIGGDEDWATKIKGNPSS